MTQAEISKRWFALFIREDSLNLRYHLINGLVPTFACAFFVYTCAFVRQSHFCLFTEVFQMHSDDAYHRKIGMNIAVSSAMLSV